MRFKLDICLYQNTYYINKEEANKAHYNPDIIYLWYKIDEKDVNQLLNLFEYVDMECYYDDNLFLTYKNGSEVKKHDITNKDKVTPILEKILCTLLNNRDYKIIPNSFTLLDSFVVRQ